MSTFGTSPPAGPPPASNRIDEKFAHLAFAVAHLDQLTHARELGADERKLQFGYHFSAFIGAAGAVRQYLQDDLAAAGQIRVPVDQPGAAWFDDFNDQVDIAAIIGLRNTDVHDLSVRVTHVKHEVSFLATLYIGAAARIRVTHKYFDRQFAQLDRWLARLESWLRRPILLPVPSPAVEQYAARYHLDPAQLGVDFMLANAPRNVWWTPSRNGGAKYKVGDPLVQRPAVIQRLQSADLGAIADVAHAEIRARIADARTRKLVR